MLGRFACANVRYSHQLVDVGVFRAHDDIVDYPQPVQNVDRAAGKALSGRGGVYHGQFEHDVGAACERAFRPRIFVRDGRRSSLHEISAHERYHFVAASKLAGAVQNVFMTVVERVEFADNGGIFHSSTPILRYFCSHFLGRRTKTIYFCVRLHYNQYITYYVEKQGVF